MKWLGREGKKVFGFQCSVGSDINLIYEKYFFVFIILINISCENGNKNLAISNKEVCKSSDILKLDETFQDDFIFKIDSVRKIQNPNRNEEKEIFIDFDKKMLSDFLKDINPKEFSEKNIFKKEYHFNIAPKEYTDSEICRDKITIEFIPEICAFIIKIHNTFLVPDNGCTESDVIYYFHLKNNKINNFIIQEAG